MHADRSGIASQILTAADTYSEQLALVDSSISITFGEMAGFSIKMRDFFEEGKPIAVLYEPSTEFGLACVSALICGCPVVPISPSLPKSAIRFAMKELNIEYLFAPSNFKLENLDVELRFDVLEKLKEYRISGLVVSDHLYVKSDTIYIVATSGTTGRPKSIKVSQLSAELSYDWRENYLPYGPGMIVGVFVFAIWELFRPLRKGATVCFPKKRDLLDSYAFVDFLVENRVEEMLFTPSLINKILDAENFKRQKKNDIFKRIILNGEGVNEILIKKINSFFPNANIWNLYSICETHDVSIEYIDTCKSEIVNGVYTAGSLMPHINAYALSNQGRILPRGECGELYLEGNLMLGAGYFNRPKETNIRFPTVKVGGKERRMYKTGDYGYISENGKVHLLGRIEHMVKVRGFSIQTDDLLSSLSKSFSFSSAILQVISDSRNNQRLVLYYTASDKEVSRNRRKWDISDGQQFMSSSYRKYLSEELPSYCIPSLFVHLTEIPVHPVSGKSDLQSLPKPKFEVPNAISEQVLDPARAVQKMWGALISMTPDDVDLSSSFSENGADSLTHIECLSEIEKRYNITLDYDDLRFKSGYEISRIIASGELKKSKNSMKIKEGKGILITGATGFFGRRVLREALRILPRNVTIYCVVRKRNGNSAQRLKAISDLSPEEFSRIVVIESEIDSPCFNLSTANYDLLCRNVFFCYTLRISR